MKKILPFILVFSALLLIWELTCHFFSNLLFVVPSPSKIAATLWQLRATFWFHGKTTLQEMVVGFTCAFALAFPLAWTMLRFATTRSFLQPLFVMIQCIPMFALAPIMVILFGWTQIAIIIPTALMIFFPLTLNIYQGLRATPRALLEYFAINGATAWQTLTKLRLPFAMPHIFAGFRISAAIAGVGAIAGEWAGAQKGLGVLMLESRRYLDLEITFGALFCLTAMSTALYGLIVLLERCPKRFYFEWKGQVLKKRAAAIASCLCLFLLGSCGSPKEQQTRLLLDWLPNPNHVPLYAGKEMGFFAEEGIDLAIQKMMECGGGINYLVSKQADLAVCHMPTVLKAEARGANLKIVGQMVDRSLRSLIYLSDERVKQPADLSGKVFGYCIGGHDTSFIDYMLASSGIKPLVRCNVSTDMIAPMGTGDVDFIYGGFWNVEPHLLRSLGIEADYFTFDELGMPRYQEQIIIANGDGAESQSAFVQSFKRALQKSLDFCIKNPEEAFLLYLKCNPSKTQRTISWERESWKQTVALLCHNQEIDFDLVKSYLEWLVERSIVGQPFDCDKLRA